MSFGGFSRWNEETACAVLGLRSKGWTYKKIVKQLRGQGHTIQPCDITHWRNKEEFKVWDTTFGEVIGVIEEGLRKDRHDLICKVAKRAIFNKGMSDSAVRNWMNAEYERMTVLGVPKFLQLPFGIDEEKVKVVFYDTPRSKAMGDEPADEGS